MTFRDNVNKQMIDQEVFLQCQELSRQEENIEHELKIRYQYCINVKFTEWRNCIMLSVGECPYSQEIYFEVFSGEVSECQQLPFKRQSKYIYTSISVI